MHRTAAVLVALAGSAASAQLFPAQFELSDLDGTNGFVLNGIGAFDFSGRSVSSAGDVNGDGIDDLIIGAFGADPNGENSGESYVVFGGAGVGGTGIIELSALDGTNGFVLNGIDAGDFSGRSVSSAGDVNGDGVDDLIIGARKRRSERQLIRRKLRGLRRRGASGARGLSSSRPSTGPTASSSTASTPPTAAAPRSPRPGTSTATVWMTSSSGRFGADPKRRVLR